MAQWWAAPTRRTMFARDMHARVRRQARPCQRLPWESRARVSSRPVRRQELDGCRARSTTAVKPRSRVDASRRTFCHHLHESVQCTHWPDAGPRRLNRAPSQADLALLRQVTPAGASLGETASAVPTAGWKYLASLEGVVNLCELVSCEDRPAICLGSLPACLGSLGRVTGRDVVVEGPCGEAPQPISAPAARAPPRRTTTSSSTHATRCLKRVFVAHAVGRCHVS